MTKPMIPNQVRALFAWMERYQPHVYRGVVRRFAAPGVAGIFDTISSAAGNVLTAASNFASTQGFEKLLNVAQPFLQTALEKKQLQVQLDRIKAGLSPSAPGTVSSAATGGPGGPGDPSRGAAAPPAPPPARELPWGWILGGTAAAIGVAVLFGGRRRSA